LLAILKNLLYVKLLEILIFFFAVLEVNDLIVINLDSKQFLKEIGMVIYIQDFAGEFLFNNLKDNGHCLCSNFLHSIIIYRYIT